jgi:RNA polymerase sigma-70 factor, ECF subfamily
MPVTDPSDSSPEARLLAAYEEMLPQVYGYLITRCGDVALAEDLTSETFLAALGSARRGALPAEIGSAWLVGVARHKLADHWRRAAREERKLRVAQDHLDAGDPWEATLEAAAAHAVLAGLGDHHRAALTLRYVDGFGVAEVALHLGRTLEATEALLTRARSAFRRAYGERDAGA